MPIEYRIAQLPQTDVAAMKQLLKVFGEAFGDLPTYQDAVPHEAYLASLLASATFLAVVAMHGAEVVGGLAAYELPKFERIRREIYIYDLAVAETHRRRGLARRLILELRRIARERGAYVIYVQADLADAPAIALYESLGTRENVLHFDIAVDQ
jgi:ribosomal protein S18 acetylase RimI-like enzyme